MIIREESFQKRRNKVFGHDSEPLHFFLIRRTTSIRPRTSRGTAATSMTSTGQLNLRCPSPAELVGDEDDDAGLEEDRTGDCTGGEARAAVWTTDDEAAAMPEDLASFAFDFGLLPDADDDDDWGDDSSAGTPDARSKEI
jgi:hypothetical protein